MKKKKSMFSSFFAGGKGDKSNSPGDVSKLRYKEADVRAIMEMGFSKDQAVWALVQNDHNLLLAINSLTG
jgi:NACalpha-BTF3-like transcription factor